MRVFKMSNSLSRIVLGGVLAVVLSTCKESDPVVSAVDTPSSVVDVSNTSNAFTLSLQASSYTDILTYQLSFETDSLFRTLVINGFGEGSIIIEVLALNKLPLHQDSVFLDGIRTSYIKCVSIPSQVRVTAKNFTGSVAFILRGIEPPTPPITVLGAWEWLYTWEGPWGKTLSPYSEGYTCQIYFMPDSTFSMFRNDSVLVCRGAFSVLSEYSVAVTKAVFPLPGLRMAYYFPSANELKLSLDITAYDLGYSIFHRRTR